VIFETLLKREKLGSTGIGQGIAIPHGKVPSISRVYGLFARLAQPVDFESVDGQPVDLVFVLLAPEHAGADHLKALAKISRLLRDPAVVAKLRGTDDAEGLYAILTEPAANPKPNASAA
jgi:PTS system nitrogen regulatory IIA component